MRRLLIIGLLTLEACKAAPRPAPPEASPPAKREEPPPTYWNRVAPIIDRHCSSCHAANGIGPMPLMTFEDVKTHAAAIVDETRAHRMPPWLPDTHACAQLRNSRALADDEIRDIERWAESGAPEGTPAPMPSRVDHSRPPDRIAAPEQGYVPKAGRGDDYHCFVIDPKLDTAKRVTALRIAPGLPDAVHHVLLFEVRPRAFERIDALDARDPGPGYTCFGGIGVQPQLRPGDIAHGELVDFDAQMIVGWAPGAGATDVAGAPTSLPAGTAIKLTPGSKLVMQVHYSLDNYFARGLAGKGDTTKVEMWFGADDLRQAVWVPLLKYDFRVPANQIGEAHSETRLPLPLEILGVAPHLHLRGKAINVSAIDEADGKTCLLDVPRWDFRHQEGYWLESGRRVSTVGLDCKWDNRSEAQPVVNGKRKPSKDLRWGEGTDDEMCLAFVYAAL